MRGVHQGIKRLLFLQTVFALKFIVRDATRHLSENERDENAGTGDHWLTVDNLWVNNNPRRDFSVLRHMKRPLSLSTSFTRE
jgi:hypothetical protein